MIPEIHGLTCGNKKAPATFHRKLELIISESQSLLPRKAPSNLSSVLISIPSSTSLASSRTLSASSPITNRTGTLRKSRTRCTSPSIIIVHISSLRISRHSGLYTSPNSDTSETNRTARPVQRYMCSLMSCKIIESNFSIII